MNKLIASAGLLAVGITGVQAAAAVAASPAAKPWTISASLRGFYDDNIYLSQRNKKDSVGFEVNPAVGVNLNGQQTSFGANYSYTLRYFDNRDECVDHTHEFNAWLNHAFTERYSVSMRDSLVFSEEPTLTSNNGATVNRTEGTVLRNDGTVDFHAQLTRLFGIVLGYQNVLYDYEDSGYSALLDRMEHYIKLDTRWSVTPQTTFIVGYKFGFVDYTDNASLPGAMFGLPGTVSSDIRNKYTHFAYVGLEHSFTPQLTLSLLAGAEFSDYYKLPSGSPADDTHIGPYVKLSLRYNFLPASYLETGFEHNRTVTDLAVLDGESSMVYVTLSHSFTDRFIGTLTGQAQYSDYEGITGISSDVSEWIYFLGLNLEYRFTQNLSANLAYNFDSWDSDQSGRSYDRNRVFMGVTASY